MTYARLSAAKINESVMYNCRYIMKRETIGIEREASEASECLSNNDIQAKNMGEKSEDIYFIQRQLEHTEALELSNALRRSEAFDKPWCCEASRIHCTLSHDITTPQISPPLICWR